MLKAPLRPDGTAAAPAIRLFGADDKVAVAVKIRVLLYPPIVAPPAISHDLPLVGVNLRGIKFIMPYQPPMLAVGKRRQKISGTVLGRLSCFRRNNSRRSQNGGEKEGSLQIHDTEMDDAISGELQPHLAILDFALLVVSVKIGATR